MTKLTRTFTHLIESLVLFSVLLLVPGPLVAESVTFAQFKQADSGNHFIWDNTGAGSTFDATAQVKFIFLLSALLPPELLVDQDATLEFGAVATLPSIAFGGVLNQPVDNGFFEVRRNSDDMLLLGATFLNGFLSGTPGAAGAGLSFSTANTGDVIFTSDFVAFTPGVANDFAFGLSSLNPPISLGANGQLADFAAAGAGTFSSEWLVQDEASVPEPASMLLIGGGLIAVAFLKKVRFA